MERVAGAGPEPVTQRSTESNGGAAEPGRSAAEVAIASPRGGGPLHSITTCYRELPAWLTGLARPSPAAEDLAL
jgi:hypothetical protein